ncbi:MAG TPA: diguanylate cyclase [Albitalea sp.]|uniref:sensor domain-containing diguanylate cyclase n=1 Tax=Piscinibacter sp. TaxID=1903157 RepID=UPI002ED34936
MTIPWNSLKLRLAITVALLMGLGVAVTVVHAVRETQQRAEQSIVESALGAGQVAAVLSARVMEHQRALSAATGDWPAQAPAHSAQADAFLARQSVLRALFDRVLLVSGSDLPGASVGAPSVSPPLRGFAAAGAPQIVLAVPVSAGAPLHLAGTLSLKSTNFLSNATRPESLGEAQLQTIVADQQGRVLAHPDPSRLLGRIDDEPGLRKAVAHWREQGAPLEPAPWTEQRDGNFVGMAAVPGTDWMVFRVAPAEALFGRASRSILRTIAIGALVAASGALAIFAVTAWFLRPMGRLQQRALRALDRKQPAHEGWPEGGGEVGQLSQVLRHVSKQLAASRTEMERSLRRMQAVLDHAPTGIAFTTDGRFELVGREFQRMLGYETGGLRGSTWERLLPQSFESLREAARAAFRDGQRFETELPLRRRDGSTLWARLQGAVVRGNASVSQKIWIVADATDARRQREHLQWSATHDPLTELSNRREFEHRLRKLLDDRRRHGPACVLFIDLDRFKQVNDNAGHAAGDALLKRIAQVLQQRVRGEDTVARLGGDEFAVLLPGCGLERATQIAEAIRAEVQASGKVEGVPQGVTASIGVVEIAGAHATLAGVMESADRACYAAKRAGRNAVRGACDASLLIAAGP